MIRTETLDDPARAAPVLRELRSTLDDAAFADRLARAVAQGYRVIAALDGAEMVGALGCRLVEDLCWGRTLFIDDLVVTAGRRGQRIGETLLDAGRAMAEAEGCDHLRLCSGLARSEAHRFYETRGLERRSLQFVQPLRKG